ncbi:hypothetical protein ACO0K2_17735 [Undibacterium sp. MH2W]|uniref:hypothetical protein n=1 Tax=Undibacterium sp. MH2W TaxID=3413044 RepID=UPI003BF43DCD
MQEQEINVGGVKVHINPSNAPSEQIIKAAKVEVNVVDGLGRNITLKKAGTLAQYRLVEALGASASNSTYMAMVFPLIYVHAIDGSIVAPPSSKGEIEALIQRLDDEGVKAVMEGVSGNFGSKSEKESIDQLKNS